MNSRSRNSIEKAERREEILNAAQKVFFEEGFESTSMDEIATKAGLSRSLLYVYFIDKKDIYNALRDRSVVALLHEMQSHLIEHEHSPGIIKVRQLGEAYYSFYRNQKNLFDCLSLNITLNNQAKPHSRKNLHSNQSNDAEESMMQLMLDALKTGIKDGTISKRKAPNLYQTAMFLRGSIHGIIILQDKDSDSLLQKGKVDRNLLVSYALDRVCDSLN